MIEYNQIQTNTMEYVMSKLTSVWLEDEVAERLDKLATALDRPRTWVIAEAVARYVDQETWEIEAIAEARRRYESGEAKTYSHEEVFSVVEELIRSRIGDAPPLA